jgi:hypothetical protein
MFLIPLAAFLSAYAIAANSTPYAEFKDACVFAFGGQDQAKICECTAQESKHQGVTVSELKKETTEIKKDPKYKIHNSKLLASFQYCTVLAMDEKEQSED